MESQNNSELEGNLREHPLAELLAEARTANLSGSFRVNCDQQKAVIYLNSGEVAFIASNSREHRLFERLLREKKISKQQLAAIDNFINDLQFRQTIIEKNILSQYETDQMISSQIEEILRSIVMWQNGIWTFSHLARIKSDIGFTVNSDQILLDYSRSLSTAEAANRLKDQNQTFGLNPSTASTKLDLLPSEAFLLSRFEKSFQTIAEINQISGLPEDVTKKFLYGLWLGNLIFRQNRNAAFSERKISEILSARISLKDSGEEKIAAPIETTPVEPQNTQPKKENIEKKPSVKPESLEDYLSRIKSSTNYYELLDISSEAANSEIKQAYFNLAKNFHPDIFHKKADAERQQEIQNAFTKIAQAYETLKDEKTKRLYDYKMRKELEEMKKLEEKGISADKIDDHKKLREADEFFEKGFSYLLNEQPEKAVAFFVRAIQGSKDNARYHAYLGKALSYHESQQHKAEAEIQTAVRLDPENPLYKYIYAEFLAQIGLNIRAKGELNRLLEKFPQHTDAKNLLDSLEIE